MMTDAQILALLTDREAMAATMWAEGRGDWHEGNSSVEERIAIGWSIKNRLPRYAAFRAATSSVQSIVLAPRQFSCWNHDDNPNHVALMALVSRVVSAVSQSPAPDRIFDESLYLADGVISGKLLDRTGGATMYYAPASMVPAGRVPDSAKGRSTISIGSQLFYSIPVS